MRPTSFDVPSETRHRSFITRVAEPGMQLRRFRDVGAARHVDAFLPVTPPAPPVKVIAAGITARVQPLESTIGRFDVHAATQTFAAEPITDNASDTDCGYRLCTTTVAILESLSGP